MPQRRRFRTDHFCPPAGIQEARVLTAVRVHTVGILATLPESTVQRLLGGRTGRLIYERAKGIDHLAVVPSELLFSASAQRRFSIDTLAPTTERAALLSANANRVRESDVEALVGALHQATAENGHLRRELVDRHAVVRVLPARTPSGRSPVTRHRLRLGSERIGQLTHPPDRAPGRAPRS